MRHHWRGAVRIIAVLLLVLSAFVAYLWFYKIAPVRRTLDPSWIRTQSAEAYWSELQTGIQRSGWGHLDLVGVYADAEFMRWAMSRTRPGDDISSCAAGHRAVSFHHITNQDPGESADEWLTWWEENRSNSQEEWIRDGFATRGVTVTMPPSEEDVVPLLLLLGNTSTNALDRVPRFMKFNAFRWLRDSDFNPVAFAVSNMTESTDAEIKTGLLEYLRRERIYPRKNRVGQLAFGEQEEPYADYALPAMLSPGFKAGVYGIVIGLPCLALGLIAWTLTSSRQKGVA